MSRVAALLAAALLAIGAAGCGGGGAEPGAPEGATLVLDFTPNAVHSGLYAAQRQGFYRDAGVDLTIREPGSSTDAPKLLEAGRADLAILDIHDLGIARERGLDLVGVMPLVQRPLASVIARADGGDPVRVDRITIGFNAVSSLASGKVDAATGFWNAEGVALRDKGVPIRVFKVDEYGAPPYPELVITASRSTIERDPKLVDAVVAATARGYRFAVANPAKALDDLLGSVPGLDRAEQAAQLRALRPDLEPAPFDPAVLRAWARWDLEHGLLHRPVDIGQAFQIG